MMRFLATSVFIALFLAASPAFALSCASVEGWEEVIPQNELIVRAKVLDIQPVKPIPLIQQKHDSYDIVTFEIIDIYKGPADVPKTFKARFSNFFKTWGPYIKEGQEGEYLFDKEGRDWVYAGPGGCTFYSDKAWDILRQNTKDRK